MLRCACAWAAWTLVRLADVDDGQQQPAVLVFFKRLEDILDEYLFAARRDGMDFRRGRHRRRSMARLGRCQQARLFPVTAACMVVQREHFIDGETTIRRRTFS